MKISTIAPTVGPAAQATTEVVPSQATNEIMPRPAATDVIRPRPPAGLAARAGRPWDAPGFTAVRELGSGGFGDVVLARHDASGTLVAIKYLHGDLLADSEFAEMFRGEATVLGSP